jgi:Xaa-Pro aminopeptidase
MNDHWIDVDKIVKEPTMQKSQNEISLLKQAMKTAVQGITTGFSAARPEMNGKDIESVVRNWLFDKETHSLRTLEVKYGKMISAQLEVQNEIQEGDFLSIHLAGRANNVAFDLNRVTVVGQPTARQRDYLDHLIEATNWMIEGIVPGRKMTFYPAESRGRLITPVAYEIDAEIRPVPRINPREDFILPAGIVLCVAPTIKSPEFGTMTHSEMVVLMEIEVEVLS